MKASSIRRDWALVRYITAKSLALALRDLQVLLNGIHHEGGFGNVIDRHELDDLVARAAFGEKVLGGAVAVAVDHLAGGIQHGLGGAVILLQQDLLALGEILLEAQHVAVICAAPAVDGLIFIAHHEDVVVISRQGV